MSFDQFVITGIIIITTSILFYRWGLKDGADNERNRRES